jgi:hypothetical protein
MTEPSRDREFGRGSRFDRAFELSLAAFWDAVEHVYQGRVFSAGRLETDDDIRFGAEAGRAILLWLAASHPDLEVREEARRRAEELR